MHILIWKYVILQLQSTILLVIYNTQKIIKVTPTGKSIIQHYEITEADMLLKIVNRGFNKIQSSYSISRSVFCFRFLFLIYQLVRFSCESTAFYYLRITFYTEV